MKISNIKNKDFWVTNISNRNVSLSDLNISIKANSSVNLLDKKHYHLNEDQLVKSLSSGSIFLKRDKIVKRLVPPGVVIKNIIKIDNNAIIPSKERSTLEIKIEEFEELKLSDNIDEAFKQEFDLIAETVGDFQDDTSLAKSK